MIEIKKANEEFKKYNDIQNDAYVCFDKDSVLGLVEYKLQDSQLEIVNINCKENFLADGLVRQTMNYALDQGATTCIYGKDVQDKLYELRIITNNSQENIDILEFFLNLNCM